MDETVTEMVVSYTNVEDPTDEAYTDYFSSALAGSRDGVESLDGTDASVLNIDETEVAANHMRFVGDFGITGAHQTIPAPVDDPVTTGDDMDEAMVSVMGSFYGIPGEFKCASQCTRSSDKDGNLSGLGGDWTFTATVADDEELADIMVAGRGGRYRLSRLRLLDRDQPGRRRAHVHGWHLPGRYARTQRRCGWQGRVCRAGDGRLHDQDVRPRNR